MVGAGAAGGFVFAMLIAVVLGIRRDLRQAAPVRRAAAA
jgi:hypothetical protein